MTKREFLDKLRMGMCRVFPGFLKRHVVLILIFSLAFALRLGYLFELKGTVLFHNLYGDSKTHDLLARQVVQEGFWGNEVFFRAPLYYYFLGSIYKSLGLNYLAPRLIQIVIGSLSCILLYLIGRKFFDRGVAAFAAIIASAYWIFITFDSELLIPSLIVFLDLLLIWSLVRSRKFSNRTLLASGFILGLSALARPNILLFAPLVVVWMAVVIRQKNPKRIGTLSVCFALGVLLPIIPVTVRNYMVGKDLVLISSQGGSNFYIGNSPKADGKSAREPLTFSRTEYRAFRSRIGHSIWTRDNIWVTSKIGAEKASGRTMRPSEISDFWFRQGLRFAGKHPFAFMKLLFKKIYFFLNGYEIASNVDVYYMASQHSKILRLLSCFHFGLIAPLGLLGMILALGKWRRYLLLYLFVLGYGLSVVIFFVNARYRIPVIPIFLLFLVYGLYELGNMANRKEYKKVLLYILLLGIFVAVANSNWFGVRDRKSIIPIHNNIGDIYARLGRYEEAVEEYGISIGVEPFYSETHNNLGLAYMNLGDTETALAEFETAVRIDPNYAVAHKNMASLFLKIGDSDRAVQEYEKALSIDPAMTGVHYELALLLVKENEYERALSEYKIADEHTPNDFRIHSSLGALYAQMGEYGKAIEESRIAVELSPQNPGVYYNLGSVLKHSQDLDGAIEAYRRVVQLDSSHKKVHRLLGDLYTSKQEYSQAMEQYELAIQVDSTSAYLYRRLGQVCRKIGQKEKAGSMFRKAAELDKTIEERH